jgi:anion-transporting  ArsA/GET3 family ATPase
VSAPAPTPARRVTDRPETSRLVSLITGKEIVVCCGSGGVGKTSVAAALALAAAEQRDGKVLVLTVDPARRLATALGIEGIGNLERQVDPELLRAAGIDARAEVWAAMLDTKQSWDALVLRHAPDDQTAYRILHNRLYDNLTARFVQSHDYIAIERLFELHNEGKYDLIIVDTPPSRNAVDFLDAPSRMREFFGGRLLRWLTLPYRVGGGRGARVISVASRPFYQIADRLIGSRFLEEIANFFLNFQSMYDGFVTRANAVEQLLRDRRTTFAVVTTLEAAPLHEAEEFFTELAARRLQLGALVCNRVLPDYFVAPDALAAARDLDARADALGDEIAANDGGSVTELAASADVRRVLHTVATSFRDFSLVGAQEHQLRADLARVPDVTVTVPMRTADVSDVEGLAWIARRMLGRTEGDGDSATDATATGTPA